MTSIERTDMDECPQSLAVSAAGLGASSFYMQISEQQVDLMSRNRSCSYMKGTNWDNNLYM